MSEASGDFVGHVLRALLVVLAFLGYVAHYLAFSQYYYAIGRGDGWSELGPGLSIFLFSPLQLAAAVSLMRAYMNADLPQVAAATGASGGYGLEEVDRRQLRARRITRAACWTLGLPAVIVGVCVLAALFGLPLPGASIVVGPLSLVWIPVWFAGVIAAFSASNLRDDSSILWLAGFYPVMSIVYAHL